MKVNCINFHYPTDNIDTKFRKDEKCKIIDIINIYTESRMTSVIAKFRLTIL